MTTVDGRERASLTPPRAALVGTSSGRPLAQMPSRRAPSLRLRASSRPAETVAVADRGDARRVVCVVRR